jgi:hypothetical protein
MYSRHMLRWNGFPAQYRDRVKLGIKNKLNRLIMGKMTDAKAVSAPVPALNFAAIEEFLRNDTEEDEEVIYNYQPHIPQADDILDCDDRGNTAGAINGQDNGQRINHKRNCPTMLSSDDDFYEDGGLEVELPKEGLDYEEGKDQFDDDELEDDMI